MATKKTSTMNVKAGKVNVTSEGASPSKYVEPVLRKSGWDDYDIRDALRTLTQAAKIRKNAPLMRAIKKEARKQMQVAQDTASSLNGA